MRSFTSRLSDPTKAISLIWKSNYRSFSTLVTTRIGDQAKQQFINFSENLSSDPYKDYTTIGGQFGELLRSIIPKSTQEILGEFGKKSRSLILLQNSPIIGRKGLPPTPTSSQKPSNKDYTSEYFMLAVADLIGAKPYLIEGVRDGSIINQVIPLDPKSISGSGSKVPFDLHNEVVHEALVPDFFLLLCLRGSPFAKTNYCFLEDILKYLPPKIIQELEKPNFIMKSGDKSVFKNPKEFRCAILTRDESDNYEIRLNIAPNRCEGITDKATAALDYVTYCLKNNIVIHDITLSPGDTLLVNNKRSLHGRTAFDEDKKTSEEGDKRWIQRVNLIKDGRIEAKTRS